MLMLNKIDKEVQKEEPSPERASKGL